METFEQIVDKDQPQPRPNFLTVLCVLSWVWIGFGLLFGVFGLMGGPFTEEEMLQQKVELAKSVDEMRSLEMDGLAQMMEQIQRMSESINTNFYSSTLVSLLVFGLGLYGVIAMYKGKKLGFHLYIGYSLLTIIQIYFFVSPADIPSVVVIWNLLISALFVFLYSRNLQWLS